LAAGAHAQLPPTAVTLSEDRQPQPLGQQVGTAVYHAIGSRPPQAAATKASRGHSSEREGSRR
jgi:hypothetical protein